MARDQSRKTQLDNLPTSLVRLRRRERSWRASRSRRTLIRFLKSTFSLYRSLHEADLSLVGAGRLAKLAGIRPSPRQHSLRIIIDAASKADRRTKSRWMRALRYAWLKRKKYRSLQACFKDNGGIAGCADKWAELRAAERTPPGCVRIGGEHRFPKIPYYVGVELLSPNGYYNGEKLR